LIRWLFAAVFFIVDSCSCMGEEDALTAATSVLVSRSLGEEPSVKRVLGSKSEIGLVHRHALMTQTLNV
jgi:hypothetical protein